LEAAVSRELLAENSLGQTARLTRQPRPSAGRFEEVCGHSGRPGRPALLSEPAALPLDEVVCPHPIGAVACTAATEQAGFYELLELAGMEEFFFLMCLHEAQFAARHHSFFTRLPIDRAHSHTAAATAAALKLLDDFGRCRQIHPSEEDLRWAISAPAFWVAGYKEKS